MYIRSQKKNPKKETQTYMDAAQFEQMPTRTLCGAADELQRFSEEGPRVGSVVLRIWSLKAEARYQAVWTYFSI